MTTDIIVSDDNLACLVGGAKIVNTQFSAVFPNVHCYIGVDGGADHLVAAGIKPAAVIGDFDSLSASARATFASVLHQIDEQDTTDFEKALVRVVAPLIYAVGFTGGRIDHTLAVLNVMARNPHRAVLLIDEDDVSFIARQPQTDLALPAGSRISLMPLGSVTVTATGLRWPVTDFAMDMVGKTSASNAASGGEIAIKTDGPLLVTLPREHLCAAVTAVSRAE